MWTCLAAMILLFLGMFIVLFTCFIKRKAKKSRGYKSAGDTYTTGHGHRRGNGYDDTGTGTHNTHTRKKRYDIF